MKVMRNCSDFDDSSNVDYHQPRNESESPSLVLEDMEGESEEDIFQENNNNNVEPMKEFVNDENWTYDNSLAKAKYLSMRMEDAIRDNPNIPIGAEMIFSMSCYGDYCETVRAKNPGSKIILRRPIIGLDGCFLKTVYQGQLLVAVGRDGNDNMMLIAIVVVQVKNRENWSWFIGELLDNIGGLGIDKWSFILDRQKGLVDALRELAPGSEHRFCVRHLYEKLQSKV
ncbi:UNVERIFIED_CONTAM: hypothetical protein Slati_2369200 [Sesamum latifolium]|uniref:MULE transposase domain-containing protein n=1 Tax=Sesamum latifolium TaxID=2727402 RepID=A0AAW2WB65_9LAMI